VICIAAAGWNYDSEAKTVVDLRAALKGIGGSETQR
jgi:hypothetical protein